MYQAVEILNNPGFYVTFAVVQAALLLLLIRALDRYEREPLSLLALMGLWGATGAAALALVGNEAVKSGLAPDAKIVFGDAIAAPIVEEVAKGLALVAAVLGSRWASRRLGTPRFEGLTDGLVYGAAVGLGFAFTEDFFYFLERAREQGLDAGADIFLTRRNFFGPAALHHPLFTAAVGAGLGLAAWSPGRWGRIGFPLLGLGVAVAMHAVNNGLIELVLLLRYGLDATGAWVQGATVASEIQATADAVSLALLAVDYLYILGFLAAVVLWQRYQGRVVADELNEEVRSGLIESEERSVVGRPLKRSALYWRLLRERRFERWQHLRRLHREIVNLALLKWRTRRFGGDQARITQSRRRIVSLKTLGAPASNLPEQPTALIGREREVAAILERLREPGTRLLTLTGPGGIGKTRLALGAAAELAEEMPGGAFFVALAPIAEPGRVPSAIARSLDLSEVAGQPPIERLQEYLFDKRLLLVLDNFEQVQAAAPEVSRLLAAAPSVKVLVTSRSPLKVSGEREWSVASLSLPALGSTGLSSLEDSAAARLFLERARAIKADLTLSAAGASAVAEVCRRLDGLPLAIELAASRVNVLTPEAMLDRLNDRLTLSSAGRADLPARQQTLRAAIAWSDELLRPVEQRLFRHLSVFSGGFTLEAVEACDGRSEGGGEELLDELTALVESSLLRQGSGPDEQPRFDMLETIREYGFERLTEHGEAEDAGERHARYHLGLAQEAERALDGPSEQAWLVRLEREYENLRAALLWLSVRGRREEGLVLFVALGRFWERRHLSEARVWLEGELGRAEGSLPTNLRIRATYFAARLNLLQGDYPQARSRLEEAVGGFRSLRDEEGVFDCLWELAWVELFTGHYARAEALFDEGRQLAGELKDRPRTARALAGLGRAVTEQGDFVRGRALLTDSLELRRKLGDERGAASALSTLARVRLLEGDHEGAAALSGEALALARRLEDKLRTAEALYGAALIGLERAAFRDATALSEERLSLCRDLGDRLGIAECLECLGAVAAATGDADRAARLTGSAEAVRQAIGAAPWRLEHSRLERHLEETRAAVSDDDFELWRQEGRVLGLERAVLYATGIVHPSAFPVSVRRRD